VSTIFQTLSLLLLKLPRINVTSSQHWRVDSVYQTQ
jgi:hypothetical protein